MISGLEMRWLDITWTESLARLERHELDLLATSYLTEQRQQIALYGDRYFSLALAVFLRNNDNRIKSLDDLRGKRVAIDQGDAHIAIIQRHYPEIRLVETNSNRASKSLLLNGEVDGVFEVEVVMANVLKEGLTQGVKVLRQTEIPPSSLHFVSNKRKPVILNWDRVRASPFALPLK